MNIGDRMKILALLNECARGTIEEWMRRVDIDLDNDDWHSGEYRIAWMDDGTAEVQDQYTHTLLRFQVEITTSVVAPEANRPTGSPEKRPWNQIPAGWFVQHPVQTSVWMEVVSTSWDGHYQQVTLRMPDGKTGTWPREPYQLVHVMPGSAPSAAGRALAAFEGAFPAVEIIEDQVS